MNKNGKIFVAGAAGLVGRAIVRNLLAKGFGNIIASYHRNRPPETENGCQYQKIDLTDNQAVTGFFEREQPRYVFLAAARVGGIHANNTYPADFIHQNLVIETNIIHQAWRTKVQRLLFLGSSCIYPKLAAQPMSENVLLTGPLEPTNEAYAIAKIAGIKLCESYNRQYGTDFRSVMPTNLYGPHDNFDLQNSHVIPALIRKFHEAKSQHNPTVELWGSGTPKREFLYVDDMAEACVQIMQIDSALYQKHTQAQLSHINIGSGKDISIKALAELIQNITRYPGSITWNTDQPDGTPRKLLDIEKIKHLGWSPRVSLQEGLEKTYAWYIQHIEENNYL